jgi:hypothetical protein
MQKNVAADLHSIPVECGLPQLFSGLTASGKAID